LSGTAAAQDPVTVAPTNYKKVFENDRLRVLELNAKPGAKLGVQVRDSLSLLSSEERERLTILQSTLSKSEQFWFERLAHFDAVDLPYLHEPRPRFDHAFSHQRVGGVAGQVDGARLRMPFGEQRHHLGAAHLRHDHVREHQVDRASVGAGAAGMPSPTGPTVMGVSYWKSLIGLTRSALTVVGKVPGMDEAAFKAVADEAKETCPVSNALKNNVELKINARLAASVGS